MMKDFDSKVGRNEDFVNNDISKEGYYHPYTTVKDIDIKMSDIMKGQKDDNDLTDSGLIQANRKGIVDALAVKSYQGERIARFTNFNIDIVKSLDIYGMGITNVSKQNIEWFKDFLQHDVSINLCMINPKLLYAQACNNCLKGTDCDLLSIFNFQIAEQHFNEYNAKTHCCPVYHLKPSKNGCKDF